jgi:putative DNA primase/helicase
MSGATPWDDIPAAEPYDEPAKKSPPRANGRAPHPVIVVKPGKRHIAADHGIQALLAAGVPFYQRNQKLQRVVLVKAKNTSGEEMMVPGIVSVDTAMMARELGRSATWQRHDMKQKKAVNIDPPGAVGAQILSMVGQWPFEHLQGIIQCPTLRRDGTLLDTPGYDKATGLVLVGSPPMVKLPDRPTKGQASKALALLSELLTEFPFVDDESKAVALSMIITAVARGAMTVAPMHLVTKPIAGTGGSYLVDCAAMIATGDRCPVQSMAPKYEETEKRLVGSALAGFPIIGLDNCREIIAGDFFCQIVERPLMSLRALGKSDMHRIPNSFVMYANGNNASVADDMVRRTIRCGLDADLEHPENRTFSGNPLNLIQRSRGACIAAALTIPLAYLAAARPNRLSPLASFEEWSSNVREPLVWLGCADPVTTQERLRAEDPIKIEKIAVFNAWKSRIGVGRQRALTTKELIEIAATDDALRESLLTVAAKRFSPDRQIDPKALGQWLSRQRGTIAARAKLLVDDADKSRPRWFLDPVP